MATQLIATFAFVGFSLFLALLFTLFRNANAIGNGLGYPLFVVLGIFFPLTMLPGWVLPLGLAMPLAWAREALRRAIAGQAAAPTLLTSGWTAAVIGLLALVVTVLATPSLGVALGRVGLVLTNLNLVGNIVVAGMMVACCWAN